MPHTGQRGGPLTEPTLHKGGRRGVSTDRGLCALLLPAALGVGFMLVCNPLHLAFVGWGSDLESSLGYAGGSVSLCR